MLILKRKRGEVLLIGDELQVAIVGKEGSGWLIRLELGGLAVVVPLAIHTSLAAESHGQRVRIHLLRPYQEDACGAYLGIEAPAEMKIIRGELAGAEHP